MEFRSRLEWAQELVKETHGQLEYLSGLRTTGKVAPHVLAHLIGRATEAYRWARAILTDAQAAQLAADNKALKEQVKRLRQRSRNDAAA